MVRYDRQFLITYLRDICALHFVLRRIEGYRSRLHSNMLAVEAGSGFKKPMTPYYESCYSGGVIFLLLFGAFLALLGIGTIQGGMIDYYNDGFGVKFGIFVVLVGLVCIALALVSIKNTKKANEETAEEYNEELEKYKRIQSQDDEARRKLPSMQCEINRWDEEANKVRRTLRSLYGANVIPTRYRDIYAAVYLYDWFSSGGSDDMDHALGMYVLEEIKSRLDRIIANQSEMILNQYVMMSNQQRLIREQSEQGQRIQEQLENLQATESERLCYEKMTEGHLATISFFAQADYFRKL